MQPIIKKENILFDVDAKDKNDMIKQMVDSFDKAGYLSDKEQFYKDVLAREEVFSTNIGYGIGIPHGKSSGAIETGICVAKQKNPVVWSDDGPVDFIIMIAVSDEGKGELHLQILSKLSRLMMHEEFRNKLKNGTKDEVYETLIENLEV